MKSIITFLKSLKLESPVASVQGVSPDVTELINVGLPGDLCIASHKGERFLDELKPGDEVMTPDQGYAHVESVTKLKPTPDVRRKHIVIPKSLFGNYADVRCGPDQLIWRQNLASTETAHEAPKEIFTAKELHEMIGLRSFNVHAGELFLIGLDRQTVFFGNGLALVSHNARLEKSAAVQDVRRLVKASKSVFKSRFNHSDYIGPIVPS